jgi:hypothetical protein
MPIFVIERQYLLPVYQHLVIEASDLAAACKEAVEGDHDWKDAVEDGDNARLTTISGAKFVPPNLSEDIHAGYIPLGEFLHEEEILSTGVLNGPALTIPPDYQTD